ncbi:MAG: thiamine ABC transporter substrate-binding protein [Bdellovibrionales bacterium]|nr:thiamine ABC transporter substrate-binding protein [Bdellovibrionales bacterium]
MQALHRTVAVLFVVTISAFAAVWIYYIQQGKKLDIDPLTFTPLRVVAYPTFVSSFGPGPTLVKEFERRCRCQVELLNAGESSLILEKILAQGENYHVDVVVGLDQFTKVRALEKMRWKSIDVPESLLSENLKIRSLDALVAFDWSPMTFIYKRDQVEPPHRLGDLLDPRFAGKVSLENPRTSTPGLQFLYWVRDVLGKEEALEFFSKLKNQKFVFADSWSHSYGLFQDGPLAMSFSYMTSAVFHWSEKKDENFQPAIFEEGHPIQVEYVGVPDRCRKCEIAKDFVKFLLEPGSQSLIMQKNYMLPLKQQVQKGSLFEKLPEARVLPLTQPDEDWLQKAFSALGLE